MEGESTIFWFLGGFFVFILFGVMSSFDDDGIDYDQPPKDFDVANFIHDAVNKRGL